MGGMALSGSDPFRGSRAGRGRRRGVAGAPGERPSPAGSGRSRGHLRLVGSDERVHSLRGARPVRLTRRGRVVLLVALLLLCGGLAALVAVPGRAAAPPATPVVAVVQPGDTLWSFAARNAPSDDPFATIAEIKRLNGLDGHTIHPGQRLIVPRRR